MNNPESNQKTQEFEIADARHKYDRLLDDTHGTFKRIWEFLMGVAYLQTTLQTVPAFKISLNECAFFIGLRNSSNLHSEHDLSESVIILVLFLFIYTPLFLRVFFGDSRYLDLHYGQLRALHSREAYEGLSKRLSKWTRFWDLVYIFLMASQFLALGQFLNDLGTFSISYGVVIGINVIFHCFFIARSNLKRPFLKAFNIATLTKRLETHEIYQDDQGKTDVRPRDKVLVGWLANNVFHFAILIFLVVCYFQYALQDVIFVGLLGLIGVASTAYDLYYSWSFYFPRFSLLAGMIDDKEFRDNTHNK